MKHQRYLNKSVIGGFLGILMLIPVFVFGAPYSVAFENDEHPVDNQKTAAEVTNSVSISRGDYDGHLVIYVIEPIGRWNDVNDDPIDYAVIDIPYNEDLFISETETVTFTWDATGTQYDDVTSDNIMVLAGLASNTWHQGYSQPPYYPFDAYYYDFTAAATPGVPGTYTTNEEFTHTIMVEVLGASW